MTGVQHCGSARMIVRGKFGVALIAFTLGSLVTLLVDKAFITSPLTAPASTPVHHVETHQAAESQPNPPVLRSEELSLKLETPSRTRATIFQPVVIDDSLSGTAWVTMASNDESGQLALTMFQSLRDTNTKVPHLVLMLSQAGTGSKDCMDAEWRRANGRQHIACHSTNKTAPEIVSQRYLTHLDRLGVETIIINQLPVTNYTKTIPGGPTTSWGAAFNKLRIFELTQFKKAVWLDGDDYFVRNVDHLMHMPALTGSLVTACCQRNGPAYAGGGIFVTEPNRETFAALMDLISKPLPGTEADTWRIGDMAVIRHFFGAAPPRKTIEPLFPAINDGRHGYVGGLRQFAKYRNMTDAEFAAFIDARLDKRKQRREGFIEELRDPSRPNFQALPMLYDQCVGSFACSPERDEPGIVYSVHLSCLQRGMQKPTKYASERAMIEAIVASDRHTRYWFLQWYSTYLRATLGEGLPAPKWEGELPAEAPFVWDPSAVAIGRRRLR